jgi:NADPH-dependent glutamate synthase beta subunit-like oxidoreductase
LTMDKRQKRILDLANHLNRTGKVKEGDPEYMILEPEGLLSDEMVDVAFHLEFRVHKSAEQIAKECGKPVEKTHELLMQLADVGVCFAVEEDGVDKFWHDMWVPGIMEMMSNKYENVKKYPQIAEAFNAYGIVRGAGTVGNFPIGMGLMRVIPIESSIDGNSKRVSYEEVSMYIEKNAAEGHPFSVSNCSCRTVREAMGEGCGHLKEDMCIQLGHAAEYYIRSGRGRQASKEEVYDIIKRAEENGLMHQIPNVDAFGETHAICNCCSCSCLSLRTGTMFMNQDMIRSNYVARVDKDKCVACGQCVENCPQNALLLGQKLCSSEKVCDAIVHKDTPRNTNWTEDKWNADYRINKKNVVETGTAPCKTACPAHIAIQGYIKLAALGKYQDALELIKKENPFPAVCGRICNRRCEFECTRGDLDSPIAIDDIKKFIADQELTKENRFIPKKRQNYGDKKVAIIGAGPSGLSCAYYLALDGYDITVFEKQKKLGGMLTMGIPSFRLEKDVVDAEIEVLRELGVKFQTGVEVGKDVTLDKLRSQGYKAFYVAIGAQLGRKLGIEGEDAKGVITGVDFLRSIALGEDAKLSGKTVVIGGGNVAIDVARAAVREGSESVDMYSLESRDMMPASADEIEEAEEEDVVINNSWGPKRIVVENGRVTAVEFKRCISVFDENKKFNPKFDENDVITVPADNVLLSVGQSIDWGKLLEGSKAEFNPNHTLKVDSFTLQSAQPDVFAGGDAVTGPKFAIDAIAAGKEGAISIHRFVQPGQSLVIGRDRREYKALNKGAAIINSYDETPRQTPPVLEAGAKSSFKDLRGTLSEEQVKKEASRCLGCGVTIVDEFKCVGCGQCTTKCKFDAISLERVYDAHNGDIKDLKKKIVKNVVKRKARIAGRSVTRAFEKKAD